MPDILLYFYQILSVWLDTIVLSPSYTVMIPATIRPDFSHMVKSGCIGMRPEGKKKIKQ